MDKIQGVDENLDGKKDLGFHLSLTAFRISLNYRCRQRTRVLEHMALSPTETSDVLTRYFCRYFKMLTTTQKVHFDSSSAILLMWHVTKEPTAPQCTDIDFLA